MARRTCTTTITSKTARSPLQRCCFGDCSCRGTSRRTFQLSSLLTWRLQMSERMFVFDPAKYAEHFAREGYVHIPQGVSEEFYAKLVKQVDENMKSKLMKDFAIGDKQQAMYEFPEGGDYAQE